MPSRSRGLRTCPAVISETRPRPSTNLTGSAKQLGGLSAPRSTSRTTASEEERQDLGVGRTPLGGSANSATSSACFAPKRGRRAPRECDLPLLLPFETCRATGDRVAEGGLDLTVGPVATKDFPDSPEPTALDSLWVAAPATGTMADVWGFAASVPRGARSGVAAAELDAAKCSGRKAFISPLASRANQQPASLS